MTLRTKRLVAAVSGGLLATAVMTGCGDSGGDDDNSADGGSSGSGGDYCGQVEDMKGEFEAFGDEKTTLADVSDTVDLVGNIGESAPDDIASSWDALQKALGDMESGLTDLGVKEDAPMQEEIAKIAKDAQGDKAKQKEMMDAMSGMQSVQTDAQKIEKQVKKECDIELSEGAESPEGSEGGDDGGS